ncbi:hypothetical protein HY492_02070 [Candidatus Woesearchaeota archaeon]|nr:hypothetical protein [Candidatus Woesearchaeota archaeon]
MLTEEEINGTIERTFQSENRSMNEGIITAVTRGWLRLRDEHGYEDVKASMKS